MRLSHIVQQVYHRPWLITPAGWQSVHRLVQSKLANAVVEFQAEPLSEPQRDGSTAVIPVVGVIGKGLGAIEKASGACGIEDVESDLNDAMNDASVKSVVLRIDSPGGTVSGVPELADKIARAAKDKPIYAFADGLMASAAYWLGAGTRGIFVTQTSDIGSIGVYNAGACRDAPAIW